LYELCDCFPVALLVASAVPGQGIHYVLARSIMERDTAGLVMSSYACGSDIKQCAADYLHWQIFKPTKNPGKIPGLL
jgi:hypothetical protein